MRVGVVWVPVGVDRPGAVFSPDEGSVRRLVVQPDPAVQTARHQPEHGGVLPSILLWVQKTGCTWPASLIVARTAPRSEQAVWALL